VRERERENLTEIPIQELLSRESGPYFYLPKLQSAEEAQLWADVFAFTEDRLGIQRGSIKCTVLIEHLLASFQVSNTLLENCIFKSFPGKIWNELWMDIVKKLPLLKWLAPRFPSLL